MNCTASQKALTLLWVIFFTVIGVLIVQAYKVIIATREKSRRCRVPTNGTVVEVRQRLSYDETKFIKLCYTPVFKYSFDGKTYINDYYVCRSAYRQCPSRNSVVPLLINKRNPEDIFIKGYVNIAAKENFAFKISSAAACFCILTILIAIAIKI
jgi:hypothetical protein